MYQHPRNVKNHSDTMSDAQRSWKVHRVRRRPLPSLPTQLRFAHAVCRPPCPLTVLFSELLQVSCWHGARVLPVT